MTTDNNGVRIRTTTIYTAVCQSCGSEGPARFSEREALDAATDDGFGVHVTALDDGTTFRNVLCDGCVSDKPESHP